jgi:hypothetical protein
MPTPDYPIHTNQNARLGASSGLRLREDTAYTNAKGEENKGIHKRTDESLEKMQETLRKVLEPDEAILYVARARERLSLVEQFFLGWHAVFASDSILLVLTNRRLLQFRVNSKGKWAQGVRGVRWGDLKEAKVKGLSGKMLYLTYLDGKKESFWQIRGDDGKKMKLIVETLLPTATGENTSAQGGVSLCPSCFAPLTPEIYECNRCHQIFKNKATLNQRAYLIPGGAYFYTGHWFLGVTAFLGETVLLVLTAVWILVALGMTDPFSDSTNPPTSPGEAIFLATFVLAFVAFSKFVGLTHGRRAVEKFMPAS